MARLIGIHHQRKGVDPSDPEKQSKKATTVAIMEDGEKDIVLKFEEDQDEYDWMLGQFPTSYRSPELDEDISESPWHRRKLKKVKDGFDQNSVHPSQLVQDSKGRLTHCVAKIPATYDGIKSGDMVFMTLGGSGDNFAYALSQRGEELGVTGEVARVFRTPPSCLMNFREQLCKDKGEDHFTLIKFYEASPNSFYECQASDRARIKVRCLYDDTTEVMKARIACGQRILQRLIGACFRSEKGRYPQGALKDQYEAAKANDEVYQKLLLEEKRCERELAKAVEVMSEWQHVFEAIKGVGPKTAAGLMSAIGDIRRFEVKPDKEEITRLALSIKECEDLVGFDDLLARVPGGGSIESHECKLKAVLRVNGETMPADERELLEYALKMRQQISRIKKRALMKGQSKFGKFCGVFVNPDGSFPRMRHGQVCNWHPLARQRMWLFVSDQCVKIPDSEWGKRLRERKAWLREKYPEPLEVEVPVKKNGKVVTKKDGADKTKKVKRYTNGHIHNLAIWKTAHDFKNFLFSQLLRLAHKEERALREAGASK